MYRSSAVSRPTVQPQTPNTSENVWQFHTLSLQSHLPEKTDPQETFDLKGNVIINLYCTQHPQEREKTKYDSYFIQVIILHTGFTALSPNPPL